MEDAQIIKRISAIDPTAAATMTENPTTLKKVIVPFYKDFKLLLATVNLRHRPISFRYALSETRVLPLGGTASQIYAVNEIEKLQLKSLEVSDYVHFFFMNTNGGKLQIVQGAKDVVWLANIEQSAELKAKQEQAIKLIHPVQVAALPNGDYSVTATGILDRDLLEMTLSVTQRGNTEITQKRALVEDIPVPYVL